MARPQDGQVGRQLPAHHRARRRGLRPARLPLPDASPPTTGASSTTRRIRCGAAQGALDSLRARLRALGPARAGETGPLDPAELSADGGAFWERWTDAIDDDLDLPKAIAVVREVARASGLPAAERRWLLLDADRILGLDLAAALAAGAQTPTGMADSIGLETDDARLPVGAPGLLRERAVARAAHDWGRADALRTELTDLGVDVVDRPGGVQEWRIRER